MKMFTLALAFFALSCTTNPAADTPPAPGSTVVVTGVITDEGAECLAMRSDDGKLYTLGRPENAPPAGTRVRVTGTVAEMSHCMQGITINVTKIEQL